MPPVKFALDHEEFEGRSMMPWFSYKVSMPLRPMPGLADRPHTKTPRLVLRPFVASDLPAFHDLRSRPETQHHSMTRGRASRDLDESRRQLESLLEDDGQGHWYVGAFLQSNGELVGEAGLPDCVTLARSGWPEAEVLLKKEYWRQGYGAEVEPGAKLIDGVGFGWEETNEPAAKFFPKVLSRGGAVFAEGFFEEFDQRDGREPQLLRWNGIITNNPHSLDEYRVNSPDTSEAEDSE
ncbi:hypothetical protein PG987_001716 [Apiospora arundinis]